ncbi:MAG: SMEK domain-containing protein [Erysipelotrichaceae bacterium]|nr:SMEK domain-containing protein [Erysipelotrichaceae bacterium]
MLNKELYIKQIANSLAILQNEVAILASINLYDINISSEDFFSGLLNLIYGFELKNVNHLEKNAPSIDLFDKKNRISVQVTSDNSSKKIAHTIDEFIKNKLFNEYDRLIVLMIPDKRRYTKSFDTKELFHFDKNKDIWDTKQLIKDINNLGLSRVKEIHDYLSKELCDKNNDTKRTIASEVETIIDLIECISENRNVNHRRSTKIDPAFKIYNRFREFAERLMNDYTQLVCIYGDAIDVVYDRLEIDEAQDTIIMMYLQDISIQYLDKTHDNPIEALNELVNYFSEELSKNGKKYDKAAIKFYLIYEMIKCNVFPNERGE